MVSCTYLLSRTIVSTIVIRTWHCLQFIFHFPFVTHHRSNNIYQLPLSQRIFLNPFSPSNFFPFDSMDHHSCTRLSHLPYFTQFFGYQILPHNSSHKFYHTKSFSVQILSCFLKKIVLYIKHLFYKFLGFHWKAMSDFRPFLIHSCLEESGRFLFP